MYGKNKKVSSIRPIQKILLSALLSTLVSDIVWTLERSGKLKKLPHTHNKLLYYFIMLHTNVSLNTTECASNTLI